MVFGYRPDPKDKLSADPPKSGSGVERITSNVSADKLTVVFFLNFSERESK